MIISVVTNFATFVSNQHQKRRYRLQTLNSKNFPYFFAIFLLTFIHLFVQLNADKLLYDINRNRFTNAEVELIQRTFLKRFGMKAVPRQEKPALPLPSYVWDMYDQVKDESVESVRHYYPQRMARSNDGLVFLQYNLSVSVQNTTEERITHANLKIRMNRELTRRRIKVYEVNQQNADIRRAIDSKYINSNQLSENFWIDMDVSSAVLNKPRHKNMVELAIELTDCAYNPKVSNAERGTSVYLYNPAQTAALVVYVDSGDAAKGIRKKRRSNGKRRHQHKKNNHRLTGANENLCRRRELQVDFNELNWQEWILAPSSYSAYQCQGECPNPLTNHFNATNHAIVQGLINSINPSLVPAPCCVPIEMQSLAILYIDVESKIVIKNYPDMEVVRCGCR